MGYSNYTFIGVFITVNNEEKVVTESHYVNSNGNKKKTPFNSETGEEHKLVKKDKRTIHKFSVYDIDDKHDTEIVEKLWDIEFAEGYNDTINGYVTIIPTNLDDDSFAKTIDEGETIEFSDDFNKENAINEFKEFFKEELELFDKDGIKYEIKFGVVNYAM